MILAAMRMTARACIICLWQSNQIQQAQCKRLAIEERHLTKAPICPDLGQTLCLSSISLQYLPSCLPVCVVIMLRRAQAGFASIKAAEPESMLDTTATCRQLSQAVCCCRQGLTRNNAQGRIDDEDEEQLSSSDNDEQLEKALDQPASQAQYGAEPVFNESAGALHMSCEQLHHATVHIFKI